MFIKTQLIDRMLLWSIGK